MNSWSHAFNLWLADYYLSATILLALVLAAGSLIREPVKRMSLAWATLPGLLALALLCAAPFWPRISLVKSNDTAAQPTIKIDSRNAMLERTDLSVSPLQPRQIQFENDQQSATVAVSTALPSTSAGARAGCHSIGIKCWRSHSWLAPRRFPSGWPLATRIRIGFVDAHHPPLIC